MNKSYWTETTKRPQFKKLEQDIDIDECIIGEGIT